MFAIEFLVNNQSLIDFNTSDASSMCPNYNNVEAVNEIGLGAMFQLGLYFVQSVTAILFVADTMCNQPLKMSEKIGGAFIWTALACIPFHLKDVISIFKS